MRKTDLRVVQGDSKLYSRDFSTPPCRLVARSGTRHEKRATNRSRAIDFTIARHDKALVSTRGPEEH